MREDRWVFMAKRQSKSSAAPASRDGASVHLDTKMQPSQERARTTFESILTTTGELLCDVGFERLSTNMICDHLRITPPALYRYFPNKYAILKELARRLMEAQDQVVFDWLDRGAAPPTAQQREANLLQIYREIVDVTRSFPGAVYILRIMRVVPLLREVQIESRQLVGQRSGRALRARFPYADEHRLEIISRLTTEIGAVVIEMALEDPDAAEGLLREHVRMLRMHEDSLDDDR